ncbi:hypothetical protein BT96DRAFT_917272 [Gymnopus androsaceus JB14]|uniref:Uncharacterized protein n=1 Tax=Gymnopus androsaceus JB14 TaxID=1447944 RepID=A0A6A4I535_9AGAR|nr:hypothetical protein BT96DRAFT_917272 [Gymnopus androsaceus JB14]
MVSLFPTVSKFGFKNGSFNVNPFLRALTVEDSRRALILSRCQCPDDDMGGCVSEDSHGSLRLKKVALSKRYFKALDIMPAPPGLVILDSWNY